MYRRVLHGLRALELQSYMLLVCDGTSTSTSKTGRRAKTRLYRGKRFALGKAAAPKLTKAHQQALIAALSCCSFSYGTWIPLHYGTMLKQWMWMAKFCKNIKQVREHNQAGQKSSSDRKTGILYMYK